jgi:O-antigen/teichoic acid export membrane protein
MSSTLARTAQGAGWVVAWRMTTRLLGLVSTLVLARLLTPADFG